MKPAGKNLGLLKVVIVDPTAPDPKETVATLEPVKKRKHTFRYADGSGYLPLGETVVFQLGEDGKARSVEILGVPFPRVDY